jgi:aspartate-semialdehyde dehydrogenase
LCQRNQSIFSSASCLPQTIWNDKAVKVTTTCIRVPVMCAHDESINLQFEKPLDEDTTREMLRAAFGVTIIDNRASNRFPTPLEVSAKDDVVVGRICEDLSLDDNKGLVRNPGLPLYFQAR